MPTSRETPANTHLRHLTTEVLRLRLGQLNLVTTGSRSALLARLTTALKDRPNASANQRQRSQTDDDNPIKQPSQPPTDLLSPPALSSLFDDLPEKTITSINNGEYIDFNSLLPGNVDGYDDNLRISFQSS